MTQLSHGLRADGHPAIGLEDPGSTRLGRRRGRAGLELVGLPVDHDGLVVEELDRTRACGRCAWARRGR